MDVNLFKILLKINVNDFLPLNLLSFQQFLPNKAKKINVVNMQFLFFKDLFSSPHHQFSHLGGNAVHDTQKPGTTTQDN